MTTLRRIAETAHESDLDFVVCGGLAVNAYHVERKTGDVDLLVRERDAARWKDALLALGYRLFQESGAFLQFSPPSPTSWPVDLILVDHDTFDAMMSEGLPFRFDGTDCVIPSVEHLIAMKLHAIRQSGDTRLRHDALDIIELAERSSIDLESEKFRTLCERFADSSIRERILSYAGKSSK